MLDADQVIFNKGVILIMNDSKIKNAADNNKKYPQNTTIEIIPRSVDLGGFEVGRVLPSRKKRTVGPFIFWDQMGPGEFLTGQGIDVRPHPHIGLSTMTYLFDGLIEHRDTLNNYQVIHPGDVNLMTAGRGIAHSERSPQKARLHPQHVFGIQCWLALPINKEEMSPSFTHYDKSLIPVIQVSSDLSIRVVSGDWMGLRSPVITQNDALFVECTLKASSTISVPLTIEERAIYILSGEIMVDNIHYGNNRMLVLKTGVELIVNALTDATIIILGGTALEEPRYLWWNFVASSKERIEQAKNDWSEGHFGTIPGDDKEFIPLPTS
jgi:hypothetical protein